MIFHTLQSLSNSVFLKFANNSEYSVSAMQVNDLKDQAHLILVHQQQVLIYDGLAQNILIHTKKSLTINRENSVLELGEFKGKMYYAVNATREHKEDGVLLSLPLLEQQLPHDEYAFIERAVELHQWRFGVGEKCRCCMLR